IDDTAHAGTDGVRIGLPRSIDAPGARELAVANYRLLAIEQAARVARGTAATLSPSLEPEVRDLFLLSEAAAIDQMLATDLPGLVDELVSARRTAAALRPQMRALTERERCVERLLCELLAAHPALLPQSLPQAANPAASLQWARTHAATLSSLTGRYRGLPPVALWGRMQPLPAAMSPARRTATDEVEPHPEAQRVASMRRRPLVRQHADDEDDSHMGLSMIQLDDPQEHVEDPMGLQRPTDRDYEADPEDLADSLSELPEARLVTAPGRPTELLTTDDP